jgi:hypothetical protein
LHSAVDIVQHAQVCSKQDKANQTKHQLVLFAECTRSMHQKQHTQMLGSSATAKAAATAMRCKQLTCARAAQAAASGACGAICLVGGAHTQARSRVACASVAAAAGLRSAVDVVQHAQVCSKQGKANQIKPKLVL